MLCSWVMKSTHWTVILLRPLLSNVEEEYQKAIPSAISKINSLNPMLVGLLEAIKMVPFLLLCWWASFQRLSQEPIPPEQERVVVPNGEMNGVTYIPGEFVYLPPRFVMAFGCQGVLCGVDFWCRVGNLDCHFRSFSLKEYGRTVRIVWLALSLSPSSLPPSPSLSCTHTLSLSLCLSTPLSFSFSYSFFIPPVDRWMLVLSTTWDIPRGLEKVLRERSVQERLHQFGEAVTDSGKVLCPLSQGLCQVLPWGWF